MKGSVGYGICSWHLGCVCGSVKLPETISSSLALSPPACGYLSAMLHLAHLTHRHGARLQCVVSTLFEARLKSRSVQLTVSVALD